MTFQQHEIEWTPEKSKRLWDFYGSNPHFNALFFGFMAGKFVARRMLSEIRLAPDARILDFSCGPGDIVAALLPKLRSDQRIYATDFSETYVDRVSERFASNRHFGGAVLTRSLPTTYPDNYFDVVMATEVIEHLLDHELEAMVAECKRILKPGGQVFFTTPNNEDYDASKILCPECGCIFHKVQHVRTWTVQSLRDYMELAGFHTVAVKPVAWQWWLGKLRSLARHGRIIKGGLYYIGQKGK